MADPNPTYDVLCIGNAIVDMIARADDAFLDKNDIQKGAMTLVDAERSAELYAAMGPAVEMSGGSAANTAAGIAALGGRTAFIGKVADDQIGEIFAHDIRALGAKFETEPLSGGDPTSRCMIFVTPDGERSMSTYLGCSGQIDPADMDEEIVAASAITYCEGYLWDSPKTKEAIRRALQAAHDNGRKTAFSLSDAFCVERHGDEFRQLIETGEIDILFANESELLALYKGQTFDEAVESIREACPLAIITRSENGSVIVSGDQTHEVDAIDVDAVIDTTGAGDLYAAGFLFGHVRGKPLDVCGRLGALVAGRIVQQMGPRPDAKLKDEAERAGFI